MAKMGGARTFFTVYASIKSSQILDDANALGATLTAVFTDAIEGMMIAGEEVLMVFDEWNESLLDLAEPIEMAKTHFRKFFDEVNEDVRELEDSIVSIGAAFNQTAAESIEAAATMAQIGAVVGGPEAQFGATQASMLLAGVGMMDTEAAMKAMMQLQMQTGFMYEGLTSQQRALMTEQEQYNSVMANSIGLVDKLNEVENTSGATIQGLIQAMNQYASAASLVNTSMDEQIALGATLIEQGEQSSKAGRSIKQMLARLASDRSDNNALLAEYNVHVRDEQGNMLTLMDVMTQLKPQWDSLNSTQQTNIAIGVAGAHHYVRFIKLMEGYDRALQIQESSINSAGSAQKEFGHFMDNDIYRMQQLQKETDKYNYIIAEAMIPINVQMLELELMRTKLNAKLMTDMGYMSQLTVGFSSWFVMASAVYEALKPMLAFVLAVKVLAVAQKTLLATAIDRGVAEKFVAFHQANQVTQSSNLIHEKAALSLLDYTAIQNANLLLKILGDKRLVHAQILNHQIQRAKVQAGLLDMEQAGLHLYGTTHRIRASELATLKQYVAIEYARETQTRNRLAMLKTELKVSQDKLFKMGTEMQLMDATDIKRIKAHQTLMAHEEAAILALETEINLITNKLRFLDMEEVRLLKRNISAAMYNATLSTEQRLAVQSAYAKFALAEAIDTGNLSRLKTIDLSVIQVELDNLVTKGKLTQTQAENLLAKAQNARNMVTKTSMMLTMRFMNVMMLGSMGLMLFAKGEEAAKASAIMMTLAIIPLMLATAAYNTQLKKTAGLTTIATSGMNLLAAAAAAVVFYGAVQHFDLFGEETDFEKDIREMEEAAEKAQADHEAWMLEWEQSNRNMEDSWDSLNTNMTDNLDEMNKSMDEFDNKRMEVFFGGRRSAMDAAMFRELKQTGIENLYFAPELYVTNNFSGLTFEEAANRIVETIEERLKDSGAMQLTG